MANVLIIQRTQALADNWRIVTPGVIPVNWLDLLPGGSISVAGQMFGPADLILSLTIGEWTVRKIEGAGRYLTLRHDCAEFQFRFDPEREAWLYRAFVTQSNARGNNGNTAQNFESATRSQGETQRRAETRPCLIPSLLFDPERRSEYTIGGLDGFTFRDDGTFEYEDQTFGRRQAIESTDERFSIQRERAGGLLSIHDRLSGRTHYFSYHTTGARPLRALWYRWSRRPRPRISDRFVSFFTQADRDYLPFRFLTWFIFWPIGFPLYTLYTFWWLVLLVLLAGAMG